MNDDRISDLIFVLLMTVVMIGAGSAAIYKSGQNSWKRPCDQFAQWQYAQKEVPARCIK